jgi:hypothetical protein
MKNLHSKFSRVELEEYKYRRVHTGERAGFESKLEGNH